MVINKLNSILCMYIYYFFQSEIKFLLSKYIDFHIYESSRPVYYNGFLRKLWRVIQEPKVYYQN